MARDVTSQTVLSTFLSSAGRVLINLVGRSICHFCSGLAPFLLELCWSQDAENKVGKCVTVLVHLFLIVTLRMPNMA